MVSPASTGTSQKEQTNPMTANPAANGSMSRASVSTQTSYPVFTSVSSAQPQPPRFAEDVYGSRRGQRFHHQAPRWHTSLIDIDDTPCLNLARLYVQHLFYLFHRAGNKEMIVDTWPSMA